MIVNCNFWMLKNCSFGGCETSENIEMNKNDFAFDFSIAFDFDFSIDFAFDFSIGFDFVFDFSIGRDFCFECYDCNYGSDFDFNK